MVDPCPAPEFTCPDTRVCSIGGNCVPDFLSRTPMGGTAAVGADTKPPVISVRCGVFNFVFVACLITAYMRAASVM